METKTIVIEIKVPNYEETNANLISERKTANALAEKVVTVSANKEDEIIAQIKAYLKSTFEPFIGNDNCVPLGTINEIEGYYVRMRVIHEYITNNNEIRPFCIELDDGGISAEIFADHVVVDGDIVRIAEYWYTFKTRLDMEISRRLAKYGRRTESIMRESQEKIDALNNFHI